MKPKTLVGGIITLLFCLQLSTVAISLAEGIPSIDVDPAHPKPKGTVTFTATFPNAEDVERVIILVDECGNEPNIGYICYTDGFNVTMIDTNGISYTTTITLKHKNAIEIKYRLGYLTGEGWKWEPAKSEKMIFLGLDTSTNSNNDGDNEGKDTNGTPGFEIISLIFAIFTCILFLKKKRL